MGNTPSRKAEKQRKIKEKKEFSESKSKRLRINQEVVDTERSYNNTLAGCIQNIVTPLKERKFSLNPEVPVPKLTAPEIQKIFANLETLSEMHNAFLEELVVVLGQDDPLFGPLFIKYAPEFKIVYSNYVNNYNSSIQKLMYCRNKYPEMEEFLYAATHSPPLNGLDIGAILITPVQRLPRYILLIKDLLKNTPENHPDKAATDKALQTMSEVTDFVNSEKAIAENMNEIMEVQNLLPANAELLISRKRKLISKGVAVCARKKRNISYFIFNDILLLCEDANIVQSFTSLLTKSSRKLVVKEQVRFDDVGTATKQKENTVVLFQTARKWALGFETDQAAEAFAKTLNDSKAACPPKEEKKVLSYELKLDGNGRPISDIRAPQDSRTCECVVM